jgi:hypothetical protein
MFSRNHYFGPFLETLEFRRLMAAHIGGNTYATIQDAINAAQAGDTIKIDPGVYAENLTVNKSVELAGAGREATKIVPSFVGADVPGGSLATGSSNVILVQADNVTIDRLTVDGNNPALTSGTVVNGVDVDARNGIITNHLAGVYQNLDVHDVAVKNVFLRGMYASSGGSFRFYNNKVDNVAGNGASIGIFNFAGSGIIERNDVSRANDAISANHSTGTQFLNNRVTDSLSGIHTDNNGDSGGVGDVIEGNSVSDGPAGSYGIWDFVNYSNVTIRNNRIKGVDVGLSQFGKIGSATTTLFSDNTVDGSGRAGSVGLYVTTADIGFGNFNASATATGNRITKTETGAYVQNDAAGFSATLIALNNDIRSNRIGIDVDGGTALIQGNDLNNNDDVGLSVRGGAIVDAGQTGAGVNFTGLGISRGGNDFRSYNGKDSARAIRNTNSGAPYSASGANGLPLDTMAQGNLFHKNTASFIESVVDHDVDNSAYGFVVFV